MSRKIAVKHVNAFTTEPFRGNPAGVVPDARGLNESRMQAIARELGMPETAFVLPASNRRADLQIRWFSPATEIPLCGHATIAAFHVLAEDGLHGIRGSGEFSFMVQTKSGLLAVEVNKRPGSTSVEFYLPLPAFASLRQIPPRIMTSLGLKTADLHGALPAVRANYLYIPVVSLSRLLKIKANMDALAAVCRAMKLIGVSLFSLQTLEPSSAFCSRFFAPAAGIPEDPVTGSANGPIGAYLYQYAMLRGLMVPSLWMQDGRLELIGEQGDHLGRKGRVRVRLKLSKGRVEALSIAGEAVTIFSGQLMV